MACPNCRESHSRKGWASHRWQALLKKMAGVYKVYVYSSSNRDYWSYSCYSKHSCSLISSSRAELGSLSVSSVLSVCAASSNGLSLFIALWAKVQAQHIIKKMEMRSYSLLTKSHPHPFYLNSKHESLSTGCLLGLCY